MSAPRGRRHTSKTLKLNVDSHPKMVIFKAAQTGRSPRIQSEKKRPRAWGKSRGSLRRVPCFFGGFHQLLLDGWGQGGTRPQELGVVRASAQELHLAALQVIDAALDVHFARADLEREAPNEMDWFRI